MRMLLSTDAQGDEDSMGVLYGWVLFHSKSLIEPYQKKSSLNLFYAKSKLCDIFVPVLTKFFTIDSIKKEYEVKGVAAFSVNYVNLEELSSSNEVLQIFFKTQVSFFLENFSSKSGKLSFISLTGEKHSLLSRFAFFGRNDEAFYCMCCDFNQNTQSLKVNSSRFVSIDSVLPKKSHYVRNILIISGLLVVGSIFSFVIYRKYKS